MVEDLYRRYCHEEFDNSGVLCKWEPVVPANFNFAYDVIDVIAAEEPNRRAMVWCSDRGEEKVFTFRDIKEQSCRTANFFTDIG
ncbi:MAG: acetyl-CoA synthetase, partial [Angelakisella sp.]